MSKRKCGTVRLREGRSRWGVDLAKFNDGRKVYEEEAEGGISVGSGVGLARGEGDEWQGG